MVYVSLVRSFALSVIQIFVLLSHCTRSSRLDGMRIARRAIIVLSMGELSICESPIALMILQLCESRGLVVS